MTVTLRAIRIVDDKLKVEQEREENWKKEKEIKIEKGLKPQDVRMSEQLAVLTRNFGSKEW